MAALLDPSSSVSRDTILRLLRCLRRGEDLSDLEGLPVEEWQALAREAGHHGLGPLLYQRLLREPGRGVKVPDETAQLLKQTYYQSLTHNSLIFHSLGQALDGLRAAGIRVLILKGAYLAGQIYEDIGLRTMSDVDLLVPSEQVQPAFGLLQSLGFEAPRPYSSEADGDLHFHAPLLVRGGLEIELHWNLVLQSGPVSIDILRLWGRAVSITLENGPVWSLAPEDLLLYLCVHAAYGHEFYAQLRSLVDIAEVLRHFRASLDWDFALATAREWRAGRGVFLALKLAIELLGADIPTAALAGLKPPDWTPQALVWARERLFREEPEISDSFLRLMSPDLPAGQRFAALLRGLFPPRAVMTRLYGDPPGSWRISMRYLPHAASRIGLYWAHFVRRLSGDRQQKEQAEGVLALKQWLGNR